MESLIELFIHVDDFCQAFLPQLDQHLLNSAMVRVAERPTPPHHLGYDEIPHYNCCGESSLNPKIYPNLVAFFGRKGQAWYYTEIGVFGQP